MYTRVRNYEKVYEQMRQLIDEKIEFAVAMLDIDHFHQSLQDRTDDEKIECFVQLLTEQLRDTIFYCGRDEFFVIRANVQKEDFMLDLMLVNRLLKEKFDVTFSGGLVEFPKNGEELHELVRNLEETVYLAKENGRKRVMLPNETKMKLKSNYYTSTQLKRLAELSRSLNRSEASLLREALDDILRIYEK